MTRFWPTRVRRGFTLIELLVVIAVIAILAALAMPVLLKGMAQGQAARCKSNLHQIGAALTGYIQHYTGILPASDDTEARVIDQGQWWRTAQGALVPFARDFHIFVCPADTGLADELGGARWWSYSWNSDYYNPETNKWTGNYVHRSVGDTKTPSFMIVFLDHIEGDGAMDGNDDRPYQPGPIAREDGLGMKRHNGGFEALFLDGHVQHFKPGDDTSAKNFEW